MRKRIEEREKRERDKREREEEDRRERERRERGRKRVFFVVVVEINFCICILLQKEQKKE